MSEFEKGMLAGILAASIVNFVLDITLKPIVLRWLARNDFKK